MPKNTLILFCQHLPHCPCHDEIFSSEFDTQVTASEEEFLERIKRVEADAAVVCFCSAAEEDVEHLLSLDAAAGPLPLLTCSKTVNPDFVAAAAKRGVSRFLLCTMGGEKIRDLVYEAEQEGGLRDFLHS
jgi:hypothetical protein